MHTVVVGAGFGGVRLVKGLANSPDHQVTLIDRNDYNFFPPLIYQVAAGFLAPSDISYPLRKLVSTHQNIRYRQAELRYVDPDKRVIGLNSGELPYDRLVLAMGAEANFFGNEAIQKHAIPMKQLSDALAIRNRLLHQFNQAASLPEHEREPYLNIVIAGGGPSGVELAGVLAEIRNDIFSKEYPELKTVDGRVGGTIELVTADPVLLPPMREKSQRYAQQKMEEYGVKLTFSDPVSNYDGEVVDLQSGRQIRTKALIWTAGVSCRKIDGFSGADYGRGNRLQVNQHLQLTNYPEIYAIGDMAIATHDKQYPEGHPQLGQTAMSQGIYVSKYILGRTHKAYRYKHRGDMAMIGRLKAVADLKFWSINGMLAWFAWVWVHIIALITAKNRVATAYNWMIAFFTRNQSLRMEITPDQRFANALIEQDQSTTPPTEE